jgi:hypothetical protein
MWLASCRDRLKAYPIWLIILLLPFLPVIGVLWLLAQPLRWAELLVRPGAVRPRKLRWFDRLASTVVFDPRWVGSWHPARLVSWSVAQSQALSRRIRIVHRILAVVVAAQWTGLIALAVAGGIGFLGSFGTSVSAVCFLAFISVFVLSLLLMGGSWYASKLMESWASFNTALCGSCGSPREDAPACRCSCCRSSALPVEAGKCPPGYELSALLLSLSAGLPFCLVPGALACQAMARYWLNVDSRIIGALMIAMACSASLLAGIALYPLLRSWKLDREIRQIMDELEADQRSAVADHYPRPESRS